MNYRLDETMHRETELAVEMLGLTECLLIYNLLGNNFYNLIYNKYVYKKSKFF